jgi:metal-responsive CopG/Arc/MetJ family transcriptional regulator
MKTAISLPDAVFREAERHARRTGKSRSQLYTEAVTEYIARHASDPITEAMNAVCDKIDVQDVDLVRATSRRVLKRTPW